MTKHNVPEVATSSEINHANLPAQLPLLETQGITRRFPGVVANHDINLTIRHGEILTILGENGAGKTTLLNILAGVLVPDSGKILVQGRPVQLRSPQEALKQGIGTVYQHFTLVPNLSIIENIVLGQASGLILNLGQAERRLRAMLGEFGLDTSPQLEVRYLSMGQQQRVEIIKALYRGSRLLLLDEPTSVLTPGETRELFDILRRLKEQGVSIVFITHKLEEALEISDRIVVLRQGRCVGQFDLRPLAIPERIATSQRIIELMFGGVPVEANNQPTPNRSASRQVVLALQDITVLGNRAVPVVRSMSLELYAGEIFGLAGVDGNGQKELAEALAGQRVPASGRILFKGTDISRQGVRTAGREGIHYITDDRLGEGCVPTLSVAENLVLKTIHRPPFARGLLLDHAVIEAYARRLISTFDIKAPSPWARTTTLSGGNIQKLLLAREMSGQPGVLICNKPTQGLDLKTTRFVWHMLQTQASQGTAILLISTELEELLVLCDRIGIIYNGRLIDTVARGVDRERLGQLMVSGQP